MLTPSNTGHQAIPWSVFEDTSAKHYSKDISAHWKPEVLDQHVKKGAHLVLDDVL